MQTVKVGRVEEFEDRGKRVVQVGEVEVGVFRLGDDFFAWHNECPHQGGPVCQGKVFGAVCEPIAADGTVRNREYVEDTWHIVCPWHGYEFDVRTGRHPGSAKVGLRPANVQVQDGEVFVLV